MDFPVAAYPAQNIVVGLASLLGVEMLGVAAPNVATGAWPTANLAILIPMPLGAPMTAAQMLIVNGATVSGNIDVGIYTSEGALVVAKGSTAQAGTSVQQIFDLTDTLLNPGLYYLAVAMDNATGIVEHHAPTALNARSCGVMAATSSFPLPATVTFSALAQAYVPNIYLTGSAVV